MKRAITATIMMGADHRHEADHPDGGWAVTAHRAG
jgi:hypothetical protein